MAVMGSKVAALLLLNLVFFTCVSSDDKVLCPPNNTPNSPPSSPSIPKKPSKCPKDMLKLGVCANLLGLANVLVGTPPHESCCALLTDLTDLEAALCLCTAIKANVLGVVKLEIPVALSLVINACGKKAPEGFQCA
ncbi:PREDICTED: 14 kDa proline-rich protein DC2.15-like [Nelumbo nucifera]|uniref:Bifunctional inhibitor/plant lipid transfer protein/seed storage helical domain-containing protein n=2 Tax=Nelumbo nucifera TaxID=4432 RepID=A0A822ZYB2_NELNU|nr:PREDICTED: 14 kDa proline-rich protein DC2.15-like [Nelumbo nucifera]DAD47826.1 TPA_asm: hypothetical protein HUJ06_017763 [Nelumbo nucifera]